MLLTYISHTHSICHTIIIRNYFNNNKSLKNNIQIIVRCLHTIIQNFLVVILYFNYYVWIIYSCSPSIALNLLTFFSFGILNVPCDSSSPGTPHQTSPQRQCRICHRDSCREQPDHPCSWQTHQAGTQPSPALLQVLPS